ATVAGAKCLLKFAQRDLLDKDERTKAKKMILLYVDIKRAIQKIDNTSDDEYFTITQIGMPAIGNIARYPSLHKLPYSSVSMDSTSSVGSAILPVPPISYAEWFKQICRKFVDLSLPNHDTLCKNLVERYLGEELPFNHDTEVNLEFLRRMKEVIFEELK